jgi:myo-inositol 2-dehydrogenase/D-chiro-inositol 1-dehydrogenase
MKTESSPEKGHSDSIGVAILGVGRMGETHLRNLIGLSRVKVVVVADPRREAAERGRAIAGAEEALTDVEKAIAHPSVDAVVIVSDRHARASARISRLRREGRL